MDGHHPLPIMNHGVAQGYSLASIMVLRSRFYGWPDHLSGVVTMLLDPPPNHGVPQQLSSMPIMVCHKGIPYTLPGYEH
jgi:hypothetical protein